MEEAGVLAVPKSAATDRTLLATIVWWALRILVVTAVLDALTTYLALTHAGAQERNPAAAALIDAFGLTGALLFRAMTGVGYLVVLGWAFRRGTREIVRAAACVVAVATAALWWMVVVSNVTVIAV